MGIIIGDYIGTTIGIHSPRESSTYLVTASSKEVFSEWKQDRALSV